MTTAKRYPLQVSEDVMNLFRECHEQMGARSIGESVKETILRLRHQAEESNRSVDSKDLSLLKRQLKHLERMRKEQGFRTLKQAVAYLLSPFLYLRKMLTLHSFLNSLLQCVLFTYARVSRLWTSFAKNPNRSAGYLTRIVLHRIYIGD